LEIAVLGPLQVTREGQRVPVPGGKTSELLVRLALEAGVLVRTERLVDDLWVAGAGHTSRNTLQSKIAKLRRALGDPTAIISTDGGYALAAGRAAVDALVALESVATVSHLVDAGDDRGAADLSATTLKLFRGEVLQAAGEADWVGPHKARLDEARMALIELQFSARLRLGDVGDVIGELEAAVARYPFQESVWELLITALYRAGRQADALATYQRVRTLLADELGLDPRPQLRQLEEQILAHDVSLGIAREAVRPGEATLVGNLPSLTAELVGRASEVVEVSELLASHRLVEIVGPGGMGKTALAIAVGRGLPASHGIGLGGVWLARLETSRTSADAVDMLVAALNVTGEVALVERLRDMRAVVILDNCEHVRDVAADLAVRLLDAVPGLRILCTSQVPLDVEGEAVYELQPLALADAIALFTRRAFARRLNPGSADQDEALLELCRSLDGLPLAIELAAARTKTLSIDEIIRRLDDRFHVLSDPTSRRPERRRSLKSTISWSYDLLFPDDQRGLWALATFAGGAPLPAVESVLETLEVPRAAAIDVVGRLATRSLVIVDDEDVPIATGTASDSVHMPALRYRLLDSIRAFAREVMAEADVAEPAFAAHAGWFAAAAGASTQGVRSGLQADHLAFARAERANIDAALAWSTAHDPLLGLAIVNGFGWAWVVLGDSRGAQRILTALEAADEAVDAADRANALLLAAWIEASTGHLELAHNHISLARQLAEASDDLDLKARCFYYLAYVVSHHGEFTQAIELTDRAREIYGGLDRPWDQAANELFAARAAISAGDEPRSRAAAARVQRWLPQVDDPWLRVRGDAMLGELARLQRRFDDAVTHIGRAAETSRRLGFLQTEAYQLASLGRAQCQAGDYTSGSATLEAAVAKAQSIGDVRLAALSQVHLGRVLRATGRTQEAREVLVASRTWHEHAGGGEQAALGKCLLAALDAADRVPGAGERLVAALKQAQAGADAHVEVFALDSLARIALAEGDLAEARDLCTLADERMGSASHFMTELDRTDIRPVRQALLRVAVDGPPG
jgi:predicted ATPase/DNA-binding SARP family transcriptional activator